MLKQEQDYDFKQLIKHIMLKYHELLAYWIYEPPPPENVTRKTKSKGFLNITIQYQFLFNKYMLIPNFFLKHGSAFFLRRSYFQYDFNSMF